MSFSIEIEPEWNMIKKIKTNIQQDPTVLSRGKDFEDAVLLTAIELVENALKYSEGEPNLPVNFALEINKTKCEIRVSNFCKEKTNIIALQKSIAKLEQYDPFELYVERLEQLRINPDGFSRMGLIRIVYEAEFKIRAEFDQDKVTIIANCT